LEFAKRGIPKSGRGLSLKKSRGGRLPQEKGPERHTCASRVDYGEGTIEIESGARFKKNVLEKGGYSDMLCFGGGFLGGGGNSKRGGI